MSAHIFETLQRQKKALRFWTVDQSETESPVRAEQVGIKAVFDDEGIPGLVVFRHPETGTFIVKGLSSRMLTEILRNQTKLNDNDITRILNLNNDRIQELKEEEAVASV